MFTEQELYDHLYNGAEGSLQLSYEDACVLQKILISNGYVVSMSGGDFDDTYQVEWVYGGDINNLDDLNKVVIASREYLKILYWKDYEIDDDEQELSMKNELTFKDHDRGFDVARALLNEDYVVMLSYEEDLLILNYEWSWNGADRNDMVFMNRCEFDEKYCEIVDDCE